jgi:hypothetical protein
MKLAFCPALLLLVAATPLAAQRDQGSPSARNGAFGAIQIATDDEDRFKREWAVTTPGARLTQSTRTVANKPLFVHVIFYGCTANAAGDCDVTGDIAFYGPDGKLENEQKGMAIWRRKAPDSPKNLYLGGPAVGFGTDDKGPFGAHRVIYKVTDNVAGITLVTEQTVTVSPAK